MKITARTTPPVTVSLREIPQTKATPPATRWIRTSERRTLRGQNPLQFKIPEVVLNRRQPAPTHQRDALKDRTFQVNASQEVKSPSWKLDEKITSRPMPQRTRLIARRSWEQPAVAKTVTRPTSVENLGWVPMPAPTQLVQK